MLQIVLKRKLKTVEELKRHIVFGQRCTLCLPFVNLMIKTGRVEFDVSELTSS